MKGESAVGQASRLSLFFKISATSWKPVLLLLALLAVWIDPAVSLNAAVLTVTSLADSGAGSLRDQVAASTTGDTIQFSVTGTIALNSAITIPHSLTIQGPGPANLIVDAGFHDRAFVIIGSPMTNLFSGMTIRNGLVVGANGADGTNGQNGFDGSVAEGGAILDTNDPNDFLILQNCWLDGNTVMGGRGGAGGANAPNLPNPGNGGQGGSALGGAVYAVYAGGGGLRGAHINCTFSHNRAIGGQGGKGGDNLYHAGVAGGTGGVGGGLCAGGAIYGQICNNTNCTFSGNTVQGGAGGPGGSSSPATGPGGTGGSGGAGNAGGAINYFYAGLLSCTIVSNSAFAGIGGPGGAGSPPGPPGAPGTARAGGVAGYTIICQDPIGNTILADNFADTSETNYFVAFNDIGYNFIGSDDFSPCSWTALSQVGTIPAPIHPLLGPLAQNGGGLPTHATTLTSPVTDQGYSFGLTTDERGAPRPYSFGLPGPPGGDGSDIGAFELGSGDLSAALGSNNVVLSWPAYYGDFTLQSSPSLQGTSNWSDVADTPVVVGNQLVVTNRATNSMTFYRLIIH